MKIAFDEHIAKGIVRVFKTLTEVGDIRDCEVCSAVEYSESGDGGDEPWLRRFAADGGTVVITGDANMRQVPHERQAIMETGLSVFFFEKRWNNFSFYNKSAMILVWWTTIHKYAADHDVSCWQIPNQWTLKELKLIELYDPDKRQKD